MNERLLIRSHTQIYQDNEIKTDKRYIAEMIQFVSDDTFLDIRDVHIWNFKPVRSLLKNLRKPKHLKKFSKWLIVCVEAWQNSTNVDINADVYYLANSVIKLLNKPVAARIRKAIDTLQVFSETSKRLKLRWALFCKARKELAERDEEPEPHVRQRPPRYQRIQQQPAENYGVDGFLQLIGLDHIPAINDDPAH